MTEISFYFNVRNREKALCQIAGKALAQGRQMVILTASPAASMALDRLLWQEPNTGFLPHCAADAPQADQTPILVDHRVELVPARDILINWTGHIAPRFEQFARVIEIVDTDTQLRMSARERWVAYRNLGFTPEGTDMEEIRNRVHSAE